MLVVHWPQFFLSKYSTF